MPTIVGLWEQIGYVHPIHGSISAWPAESLNASVREFLWFGPDGVVMFGRFGVGADVSFDESRRVFLTGGRIEAILCGRYQMDGNTLTEEWNAAIDRTEVRRVELAELRPDLFVVKEPVPHVDFALLVAYKRVPVRSPGQPSKPRSAERPIQWEMATAADRIGDYFVSYKAVVNGATWLVAVNDFPAEQLYSLIVDGKEVRSFNEWPKDWVRPEPGNDKSGGR